MLPTRRTLLLAAASLPLASRAFAAAPPLFPPDNPWNQRITSAPVAANSDAIMNSIIATYGNGRLHPDFGQSSPTSGDDLYGIPFNIVRGNSLPHIPVVIDAYAAESDIVPCPIPPDAVLEGDFQNGPRPGLSARGDSHLLIWDIDTNTLYEFFRCSRPSENADGKWHADSQAVWNAAANSFRPRNWTSADAAGLPILPGLVRPDQALPVADGGRGVIDHAIRFTLRNAVILDKFLFPASHTANPGNTNPAIQPPMGARFRLKASVNIAALNPQSRIIAQAMKDYGLILADNGSNFFFTGASYSLDPDTGARLTWNDDDIQSTTSGLKSLRYADFEVVDLTPIITGLSPAAAPAGSIITITGQNFSGAAGKLSVLFGTTLSPSVTFIDDARLTARVPAGAGAGGAAGARAEGGGGAGGGTVDVRIRSGIIDPSNSKNIRNPIFGYGLSAISPAAAFTYQAACAADFNGDGSRTVQDLFDYLAAWFARDAEADFNHSGSITVQDLFDFLAAWFVAC